LSIVNCSFVVDGMLGTLARWLRILGYDTRFDPGLDDHQLLRLARAENRVLLTRDRELARRRGARTLFVTGERLEDQIRQVLTDLNLAPGQPGAEGPSRCPVCNTPLEAINRQTAAARVPAYVAQTQDQFRSCPGCQRVYWRGSHWQQMVEFLDRLQNR